MFFCESISSPVLAKPLANFGLPLPGARTVLEINLEGTVNIGDGNRFCQKIREASHVPLLFFVSAVEADLFFIVESDLGALLGPEQLDSPEERFVALLPCPVQLPGIMGDGQVDPLAFEELFHRLFHGIKFLMAEDLGSLKIEYR
jgi:hypothetical protein